MQKIDFNDLELQKRFWSKVRIGDDCWEWDGGILMNGYPAFWFNGITRSGHGFAFSLWNKVEIPNGLGVLHKCSNRRCCNPDHLYLGTAKDNSADMIKAGRGFSISKETILGILQDHKQGLGCRVLAAKYGLGTTTIKRIFKGRFHPDRLTS